MTADIVQKHCAKLKEIVEYVEEDGEKSNGLEEGYSISALHFHVKK
jgi:hypothetical protein